MAIDGTIDRFPEYGRSRAELLERARDLGWYHTLRLDDTLTTPGIFALDEFVPFFLLPDSLRGLRCLEVGAGNGYWSFQMERRGAESITATDIGDYHDTDFSTIAGQPHPCPNRAEPGLYGEPYRVAATLFGSKVDYRIGSVYELSPESLGTFDFVFCSSVLMHLFAPLVALRRIAAMCRNTCVITTQTDILLDGDSLARFRGHEIPYVHFVPSPSCLEDMMRSCGYEKILRGPTFMLRFRDRASNPDELVHTTLIGLKDAARPAIELPAARTLSHDERSAAVEIVWTPDAVAPGQEFSILVRVTNQSHVAWRGDGEGQHFYLAGELRLRTGERDGGHWSSLPAQPRLIDYLPSGVSTLGRVKLAAPLRDGMLDIKPAVWQGRNLLGDGGAVAHVPVVAGAALSSFGQTGRRRFEGARRAARVMPGYGVARAVVKKVLAHLS